MTNHICHGTVRHRRLSPKIHAFGYPDTMFYLSLCDIDNPRDKMMRECARRIRRSDHLGDPSVSIRAAAIDLLATQLGIRQTGPIDILTHIRQLRYVMNPVSFYYCWNEHRTHLTAIIAEINNTPWGERFCYAFPADERDLHIYSFEKEFHVSPFMDMNQQYVWTFRKPSGEVHVTMRTFQDGQLLFEADLQLTSRPLTHQRLKRFLLFNPFTSTAVISRIYLQALFLWLKRMPYYRHPRKNPSIETGS